MRVGRGIQTVIASRIPFLQGAEGRDTISPSWDAISCSLHFCAAWPSVAGPKIGEEGSFQDMKMPHLQYSHS